MNRIALYRCRVYLADKQNLSDALSLTASLNRESCTTLTQSSDNEFFSIYPTLTSEVLKSMEQRQIPIRRVLSLKERIDVISLAETLRDTRELARRFECGRTQILSILKQKERLLKEWANNGDPNRLRRRPSAFAVAINRMLSEWINRCRSIQIPLNDRMIIEKACQAKKFFKYSEFRANKRWLGRFKRRFRLEDVDLTIVDPNFSDGIEKSLKLSDIFEDVKDTMDPSIIETMSDRESSIEHRLFLMSENNVNTSPGNSLPEQVTSSNNGASEVEEIEDLTWHLDSYCETEILEEPSDTIKTDQEALECLKKLEEYSMLNSNFRAIGFIIQLEKLYKGELEA